MNGPGGIYLPPPMPPMAPPPYVMQPQPNIQAVYPYFLGMRHQVTGYPIFAPQEAWAYSQWFVSSGVSWQSFHYSMNYFRNVRGPHGYFYPGRQYPYLVRGVYERNVNFQISTYHSHHSYYASRHQPFPAMQYAFERSNVNFGMDIGVYMSRCRP